MELEKIGLCFSEWMKEALEEVKERAEELKTVCWGYQEELKSNVQKPTFLLPKTPVAKRLRRIRSRKNENEVPQSDTEVRTTGRTRSTRNTNTRNTLQIAEPSELQKNHRNTSKDADKHIREDENSSASDTVRASEGRKRALEDETEVQEAPRKTRRIGKKRATNKCNDSSEIRCEPSTTVNNKTDNDSAQTAVEKTSVIKLSDTSPIKEKNSKSEVKSDVKGSAKNESITDSAIFSQAASDLDNINNSASSAQSMDMFQNVRNEVESSPLEVSQVSNASSTQEPCKTENSQGHKICDTTITIAPCTEENTSVNESLEIEKARVNNPANSTFVSSVKLEVIVNDSSMPDIKQIDTKLSATPVIKLEKLSASEIKILTDITGKTNSSSNIRKAKATAKATVDSHPKTVFSPYASSPVKDRVAAFERLKNEREKLAQQAALAVKGIEENGQPVRMTRTKARALAAAAAKAKEEQANGEKKEVTSVNKTAEKTAARIAARKSLNKAKKISAIKERRELEITPESECGKENSMSSFSTSQLSSKGISFTSTSKKYKTTPLLSNSSNLSHSGNRNPGIFVGSAKNHYNVVNGFVTGVESLIVKPSKIVVDDMEKRKEEIRRRMEKEEEAKRKKEELLRARMEEHKRKREEKMQKAQQAREIREKEKLEMKMRLEKEKEEKYKLVLQEREEKIKEQLQQKKQQAQQKAAEMEERRKLEEAARKAKIKEQEEEQQRLQAARKKEQEEHQRHLAEEREAALLREQQAKAQAKLAKEKELREIEAKEKMAKEKMKAAAVTKPPILDKTFDVSQTKKVSPVPNGSVNGNDYGIDEDVDESSDEEDVPKRPIPLWARRDVRKYALEVQSHMPAKLVNYVFYCEKSTPNIPKMFNHIQSVRRTSSAIWRTPPRLSTLPKL